MNADEGRQRLVEAATELLRQRPPDRVSVREIASAAGVNHGLVHRYFGGKEGLVMAVLRRVFRETGAAILEEMDRDMAAAVSGGLSVLARERWVVDLLAHVMLTRRSAEGIPTATMMPALRERLGDEAAGELAGALAVAEAATLGWLLFEPLIARGTGLDALPAEERRARVAGALAKLLEAATDEG
jgi:AcrR family transcriptional regulator